jgi:hypothetical protein
VSSEYFAAYAAEMDKVRQRCERKVVTLGDISFRQDCYESFGCKIVKSIRRVLSLLARKRGEGSSAKFTHFTLRTKK